MTPDVLPARQQRLLLAAVVSGLLLAMLDQTVVGTALPHMVRSLGGESRYVWVVTAYLVPATVTLPVYARLSDRYGRKAMLLTGMALFLLGSLLSATATSMDQLVLWRGLQGCGAGALEGLSFILVADLYAGRRSAALQGVLAGLMGVSWIGGPLLGGLLTDTVGWRAVFLVNLPVGVLAVAAVVAYLPAGVGRHEGRSVPVDLAGIATLTLALGLVLVGLSERAQPSPSGALPGWLELRTGGALIAGVFVAAVLVAVERRAAAPVLPLALLRERRRAVIVAAATTGVSGLFAAMLLLPRYYQLARHASATSSGLLVYPLLLGLIVSVNGTGAVLRRRPDFRAPVLAGQLLAGAALLGYLGFARSTPDAVGLLLMACIGVGVGPSLSGLQVAMQTSVAPQQTAGAMGMVILLRQVGGSVALAAAGVAYAGVLDGDPARAAVATGHALAYVGGAGSLLAVLALSLLRKGDSRIAFRAPALAA
ncbi:EmrB/QacA subfamily drug resistance transporter [Motilibacter rhizosphaerae]|uniref:EmrB/QacA subfamily drug resistance transporter n=1 Tax=Motilibacter rhizosphaerae TaxID=598652 RepID=A0A4Q7NW61_9ACTN|nr:MFS transporter [Motilibacter rhizosphaerae]RZS91511.1 EmrB/QacA subfamily drug resistance transporter [Motilibacter rhizosphaerae]